MACRTTVVSPGKDSVPADSGAFRSQFCGREIVNVVLIAIENRIRLSERIGQFMREALERYARMLLAIPAPAQNA
jgi:hypothetical protein